MRTALFCGLWCLALGVTGGILMTLYADAAIATWRVTALLATALVLFAAMLWAFFWEPSYCDPVWQGEFFTEDGSGVSMAYINHLRHLLDVRVGESLAEVAWEMRQTLHEQGYDD